MKQFLLVAFLTTSFIGSVPNVAHANPIFGTVKSNSRAWADGCCSYEQHDETTYVLWIPFTRTVTTTTGCLKGC